MKDIKELNEKLVSLVNRYIPSNIKLVPYLMDKLQLSKEPVYRRIKGEVAFTFEEVYTLATELEFSLDEVSVQSRKRSFFTLPVSDECGPQDSYLNTLTDYFEFIKEQYNTENAYSVIALNTILPIYVTPYEGISRFMYFKWLHLTNSLPVGHTFSSFILSPEIINVCKKINYYAKFLPGSTFLVDEGVYLSVIKDIQYYYKRKLISDADIKLLKEELQDFVKISEKIVTGKLADSGVRYFLNISAVNIKSNTSYSDFNGKLSAHIWVYPVNAISIKDPDACKWHKDWVDSLIKYSVLINESNDMFRIEFFKRQYEYIDNMDKIMY